MKNADKHQARRAKALAGLKEALKTVEVGYPYFDVPTDIRRAIKWMRDDIVRDELTGRKK